MKPLSYLIGVDQPIGDAARVVEVGYDGTLPTIGQADAIKYVNLLD